MEKTINQKTFYTLKVGIGKELSYIAGVDSNEVQEQMIRIENDNLKDLALTICPELQSELEKAKELLKESKELLNKFRVQNKFGRDGKVKICSQEMYNQAFDLGKNLTTFLEGSGLNKTKIGSMKDKIIQLYSKITAEDYLQMHVDALDLDSMEFYEKYGFSYVELMPRTREFLKSQNQ